MSERHSPLLPEARRVPQSETSSQQAGSDPLLQPFRLKHLVLRNRIMSTSHACGLAEGGMPSERYQRYHEAKAKGGLALTMFGGSSNVSPNPRGNCRRSTSTTSASSSTSSGSRAASTPRAPP